jgi:Toprim domain
VTEAENVSRALAGSIEALAAELLPGGHREGHEWRAGSIKGEAGGSLGVHLSGHKPGIWSDFATGDGGDALDLVKAVYDFDTRKALAWARRWLGIDTGTAELPCRFPPASAVDDRLDRDRWRWPWQAARPIGGTLADAYLAARGLHFDDAAGRMLRFAERRARRSPAGEIEHYPAMLCVLSDARTGEQCGVVNIHLRPDGCDRIRDRKGKTCTGRARGAVVLLSDFGEPTMGLTICEGVETGIAIYQTEQRPIWACGGAGMLAIFPVLAGIDCLTVAADADEPGQRAAQTVAERWRQAGREVVIVAPPIGDWANRPEERTACPTS